MPRTDEMLGTVVVAIGGNALSPSGESSSAAVQFRHTRESLGPIVEFALEGWKIAVVHGNGPQVGNALLRNEQARDIITELPLGVLVAATGGWIGYMIQQCLHNALRRAGSARRVVTLITQTVVDPDHPSASDPVKPIGRSLEPGLAQALRREGVCVEEDTRGLLRRKVPSPRPIEIVEAPLVAELVARGDIVIAAGGGGPPVQRSQNDQLEGLDAVVDKDRAAAELAVTIGASVLLILTDVEGVFSDWGTPAARVHRRLTVSEGEALLARGGLGAGSMEPKLEAAIRFVRQGGERAIIARLTEGRAALAGEAGTCVLPNPNRAR